MTIIEQARALLAFLERDEPKEEPQHGLAALCRALIVRTDALRELVDCAGQTPEWYGANLPPFYRWHDAWIAARRALTDEPHTGHD